MGNGVTVSANVSPEFNETIERIHEERDDLRNKSDTIRHLLREGAAAEGEQLTRGERFFKTAAVGLSMLALIVFAWASMGNYPQPAALGAWMMVPALLSLLLYDQWSAIRSRFGRSSDEPVNPSEA